MAQFRYRCPQCGAVDYQDYNITQVTPPEYVTCGGHADRDGNLCCGLLLKRLWEMPNLNLGFRSHKHDQNDEFKFKHL